MGAYRKMGFAAFAAVICLVWGVPTSAQASSAPVIESESVSNITPTDATMEARINSEGLETTYEFHLQEMSCREANPPCMMPQHKPLVLPSGKLLGSFVGQSVSADANSAGVTLCPADRWYWVTATNSAGTTIGQRQRIFAVWTLVAIKCTPSPEMRILTNAQKLTSALRACKRKPRKRRARCEKQAHKQYGTTASQAKRTPSRRTPGGSASGSSSAPVRPTSTPTTSLCPRCSR